LTQTQQALSELAVRRQGGFVSARDVVIREVMPYLDQLHTDRRVVSGVATGLTDLTK
jgi:replicative DNA helicase